MNEAPPGVETEILVRFAETDAMGIVHHANYLIYFEAGRVTLSKAVGAPYAELEDMGFSLAVVEANVRYIAAARFDQRLTVRTWVERLVSRSVTFGYEIHDAQTGALVTQGWTKHLCLDREGRVVRIPQRWLDAMQQEKG